MKKKLGFTLAEVLITLGIIGVVAALTAPALVQNAGTAKVGPTLAKVVSTMENANEQILHDEDTTKLSSVAKNVLQMPRMILIPRKEVLKAYIAFFYVDINGVNKAPNSLGKDLFVFYVDKSGQILPSGGSTLAWLHDDDVWKYTGSNSFFTCNEKEVITGIGCAGSIFENDFKVIYE